MSANGWQSKHVHPPLCDDDWSWVQRRLRSSCTGSPGQHSQSRLFRPPGLSSVRVWVCGPQEPSPANMFYLVLLRRAAMPSCLQRSSQRASVAPAAEGGPGERLSSDSTAAGPPHADSAAGNRADALALPAQEASAVHNAADVAAPAPDARSMRPPLDAHPAAAKPRVLACTERVPPEHAGCATFYMIRSTDGPVQPLGVPELAAGVDCGLLPQGPTLASLEQVQLYPCMTPPTIALPCSPCVAQLWGRSESQWTLSAMPGSTADRGGPAGGMKLAADMPGPANDIV